MKAVVCETLGPPDSLHLRTIDLPPPSEHEVQIGIEACGINFPDLLMIEGKYQERPPLPFTPCGEIAGTVVATGSAVSSFAPGDKVMAITYLGGLAERINLRPSKLIARPESMPATLAAAFPGAYGTSYHALKQRAALKPGDTLLVLGAAGGVGLAAVQLGQAMGARVIAVVGGKAKVSAMHRLGVSEVIDYQQNPLKESVLALTDGRGVDVVYDPIGGDLFDQALRCMGWNGRLLVVGFASGRIPALSLNLALLKGISVTGVFFGRFEAEEPEAAKVNMTELMALYTKGGIKPHVHQVFAFNDFRQALTALTTRDVVGKVVVQTTA